MGDRVFQSFQHMGPVRIGGVMITVMEKNNVAGSHVEQAAGHTDCRLRFPVVCGNGPHDDVRKSHLANRGVKLRTSKAEWRAHCGGALTCGCEKRILTSAQFVPDLPASEEEQAGMSVRMIPDSVIGSTNLRSELRMLFNVLAKNEERRGYPIFFQQREQLRCDSRIRSIIKSESAGISCTAQRRSE